MEDNIISKWLFKYGNEIVRKKTEEKIERLMENIHILPSRFPKGIHLLDYHITSAEKPKGGDWYITPNNTVLKALGIMLINVEDYKKIILTTDQDLIADGVQPIGEEFFEWFVKHPECEEVEVKYDKDVFSYGLDTSNGYGWYKIIIPQEEPKQLTDLEVAQKLEEIEREEAIEEAAIDSKKRYINETAKTISYREFIEGAKWQQERMYVEADKIMKFLDTEVELKLSDMKTIERIKWYLETFFEQFKKK